MTRTITFECSRNYLPNYETTRRGRNKKKRNHIKTFFQKFKITFHVFRAMLLNIFQPHWREEKNDQNFIGCGICRRICRTSSTKKTLRTQKKRTPYNLKSQYNILITLTQMSLLLCFTFQPSSLGSICFFFPSQKNSTKGGKLADSIW